jgi:hypothetical protein
MDTNFFHSMKWKIHRYVLRVFSWPFRTIWRLSRGTDRKLRKFASWTEKSGYFQILKLLEVASIIIAIAAFCYDLQDRKIDRENRKADSHNQAWSLISSVSGNTDIGNIGVGNALEMLNKDGIRLDEIRLPGSWLQNVNLSGANLAKVHFEKASLRGASLSGANLSGANLWGANLRGANLSKANFSEADLHAGRGLTQSQIDYACYRKVQGEVHLPDGFKQPPECPEKKEFFNETIFQKTK